ncbi:phosphatase PAP2 family protein [Psychrobacter sp.]|uniref:phosphatase PAP2 family protein n=1 Tax=Psychrobacter sp. TaxID=56811 RepID=UPI0025CF643B|nr:phosphatase PAP2 family protein [Psychrobacter sp.]
MNLQFNLIRNNYLDIIHYYRAQELCIPKHDIGKLIIFFGLLIFVAFITYITGGYHAGFIEINGLTPYLPEFLLQNITVFGDGALLLPLVLLFAPRNTQLLWTVLFASIVCAFLSNFFKDYFGFDRPPAILDPEIFNLIGPSHKAGSFPSGHTLTAFSMASICFCYFKNQFFKYSAMFVATLVGLSRVLIGVHWPIDVLVGAALGIAIGVGAVVITMKWLVGLRAQLNIFTLTILVLSCLVVFIDGNDYKLALPLMYSTSILALVQGIRSYVFLKFKPKKLEYIEPTYSIKAIK